MVLTYAYDIWRFLYASAQPHLEPLEEENDAREALREASPGEASAAPGGPRPMSKYISGPKTFNCNQSDT